jgi:hypothetical protein
MTDLRVFSLVYYLTTAGEGGPAWRDQDWVANKIIKCVKGEPINGYVVVQLRTGARRFDESSKDELLNIICRNAALKLGTLSANPICVVPIPNSGATVKAKRRFRTWELADRVAGLSNNRVEAVPALRWKIALAPSHKGGGPRDPGLLLDNLVMTAQPQKPAILFDDVLTSGGHMVACYRCLSAAGITPVAGVVIGRATPNQQPKMVGWQEELLPLTERPIEFDEVF